MSQPLITVIIPCYNVEKYLSKCIDSVLVQTYVNLEIILIDDGSPDNCGKICDEYAQKDIRIHVIHKLNGGLSDARNKGLDIACGEYITFIDSDDYISNDYIETLYNLSMEYNAQMSICLPCVVNEIDGNIISINKKTKKKILKSDEALIAMFYQKEFDTSAWAKLYHKSLFDNIYYPEHILYEDLATTYKLIQRCTTIAITTQQNYFYLLRENSIEGSPFNPLKYKSLIKVIYQLENDMLLMKKDIQKALASRITSFAFHVLLDVPKEEQETRNSILQIIKKYRLTVMLDNKSRKKTRIACLLSYFGYFFIDILATKGKSRIN